MSDHSAIQNVVKLSEIDCNLLFAKAECTSTAAAVFQTSTRLHEENDSRYYSMAHVRACGGDHKTALVLAQLEYWTPKAKVKRDGFMWIKKSVTDWEAEMMLGRKEIDRINKALVQKGLVVMAQYAWGHFKSPSAHYRLTEKALALIGAPAPKGQVVSKAPVPKGQVTDNTKTTENTKNQTLDSASTNALAKPSVPTHPEDVSGGVGKAPPVETQPAKQPSPVIPDTYLKKKGKQPLALKKVWEDALQLKYPGAPIVGLGLIECRQLAQIRKKLYEAGVEPNAAIRYLIAWWGPLSYYAMHKLGRQLPKEPSVSSLLTVIAFAAKWYAESIQKPPPFSAKPEVVVVKNVVPKHVPATLEEITALEAQWETEAAK